MLSMDVWRSAGLIVAIICGLTGPGVLANENELPGVIILVAGIVLAGLLAAARKAQADADEKIAHLNKRLNLLTLLSVEKDGGTILDDLHLIEAVDEVQSKLDQKANAV